MSSPTPLTAESWLALFQIFLVIGVIAGGTVIGAMIYFTVRYRRREGDGEPVTTTPSNPSRMKETLVLASISVIILFALGIMSVRLADQIQYPPPVNDSLVIRVTAFQWSFRFTYPNGYSQVGLCRVPANKNIIFNVTSTDVMHDFGLPGFKIKIDAIPGRYNILWMVPPDPGPSGSASYQIKCYELCGVGHADMVATLMDMDPTGFNQWYNQTMPMSTGG